MTRTRIPELHEAESLKALSEVVSALLERWKLDEQDQLALLGLTDASELASYRQGAPLGKDRELLERVGHLLAIDRALQAIYPQAPEMRDGWIKMKDFSLDNKTPLEVVRLQGLNGLRQVRRQLEKGR
jgi:hypothetical protein